MTSAGQADASAHQARTARSHKISFAAFESVTLVMDDGNHENTTRTNLASLLGSTGPTVASGAAASARHNVTFLPLGFFFYDSELLWSAAAVICYV